MEKLIELFKEYVDNHGTDTKNIEKEYGVIDYGQGLQYGTREYLYEIIVSKKFGFIKWLVENDKIDLDEINNNHLDTEIYYKQTYGPNYSEGGYGEIGYWYKCIGLYESLLCNLAISDTPIEDLISYLK